MQKIVILLVLILWSPALTFSQSRKDYQTIVQSCLDQKVLSSIVKPVSIMEEEEVIHIYNNGIIPGDLTLTCEGYNVRILSGQDMFFYGVLLSNCIRFNIIIFDKKFALADISYESNNFKFNFSMSGGNWKILK